MEFEKKISIDEIKQFISYFFVGGISAIVEWVMFAVFANIIQVNYLVATVLAFIFSTSTNWILGRIWTFRDNKKYKDKLFKEIVLIFIVSAIGLLFNIVLMYLFVTVVGLTTPLLKTVSKMMATGIVFIWNYYIRKALIYR